MNKCPSRYSLVAWKSGELSEGEAARVAEHVAECETCAAEVTGFEDNWREYGVVADQRRSALVDQLQRLDDPPDAATPIPLDLDGGVRRRRRVRLVGLAAAAVVVTFAIFQFVDSFTARETSDDILFRGEIAVAVYAQRDNAQFRVNNGAQLKPADAVRFVVTIPREGWLSVFAVDATGQVSPFYPDTRPEGDPRPLRLKRAGRHELPGSIVLDHSLGEETFFIAFSPAEFDRRRVHARLSRATEPTKGESEIDVEMIRVIKIRSAD